MEKELSKYIVQYSLNPNLLPARDKLFSFIILKILADNNSPMIISDIRKEIESKYDINLPDIILNDTLDKLTDIGDLNFNLADGTYSINFEIKVKLKDFEVEFEKKFDKLKEWFLSEIKLKFKEEISKDLEKILMKDLMVNCNRGFRITMH